MFEQSNGTLLDTEGGKRCKVLLIFTEQRHVVKCCLWAQDTSTAWWDPIIMQAWDDDQWLQDSQMFLRWCAELIPALQCRTPK